MSLSSSPMEIRPFGTMYQAHSGSMQLCIRPKILEFSLSLSLFAFLTSSSVGDLIHQGACAAKSRKGVYQESIPKSILPCEKYDLWFVAEPNEEVLCRGSISVQGKIISNLTLETTLHYHNSYLKRMASFPGNLLEA